MIQVLHYSNGELTFLKALFIGCAEKLLIEKAQDSPSKSHMGSDPLNS